MSQISGWTETAGRFKDIKDMLFEIEGTGTVYQDMATIVPIKDHTTYWVEEKYSTGTSNSSQKVEGATLVGEAAVTKTTYDNLTEINAVTYDVTDRMQSIAKAGGQAGVKDQIKQSLRDAMIELKARVERSVINGTKSTGDATHLDKMEGIVQMAKNYGTTTTDSDTAWGSAAEAKFRAMLQDVRDAGGLRSPKGKMVLMSYPTKDAIAFGFKGIVDQVQSAADKNTIYGGDIRIYSSQFGDLTLMPSDAMVDNYLVVFEKEFAKIGVLQPMAPVDLARTGLSKPLAYSCDNAQVYQKPSTLGYMFVS